MMMLRQRRHELERNNASRIWVWPLYVSIVVVALTGYITARAHAQPAEKSSEVVEPETFLDGEVQPRGERKPREIKFSAWQKLCFKTSDANKMLCRTTSNGTWDSGQTVVRIDLIERDGALRVQMFLPTGVYLQAGVSIAVDKGAPIQIPYTWCFANGCVAATTVSPDLIGKIKSGQELILKAVDSNVLTVSTSIPLAQFSAIHEGPPTQVFDRGLQGK
jgi:invasion protein IalB